MVLLDFLIYLLFHSGQESPHLAHAQTFHTQRPMRSPQHYNVGLITLLIFLDETKFGDIKRIVQSQLSAKYENQAEFSSFLSNISNSFSIEDVR